MAGPQPRLYQDFLCQTAEFTADQTQAKDSFSLFNLCYCAENYLKPCALQDNKSHEVTRY